MAPLLALAALLRRLAARELRETRSVFANTFLFCIVFLMAGSQRKQDAFWATALFQLFVALPLLAAASLDAQERIPRVRRRLWPLGEMEALALSAVSFAFHPLLLLMLVTLTFWVGWPVALGLAVLAGVVHLAVYALAHLRWKVNPARVAPRLPGRYGAVMTVTIRQVVETLDFWTALLLTISGAAYRLLGQPAAEALPVLAIFVVFALSTVAQRLRSLDGGTAEQRYRLLPVSLWRLRLAQDAAYLVVILLLVLPLHAVAGLTCALAVLALGRYPAMRRHVSQRRWRFTSGDLRVGALQLAAGAVLGVLASRGTLWAAPAAAMLYLVAALGEAAWLRRETAREIKAPHRV